MRVGVACLWLASCGFGKTLSGGTPIDAAEIDAPPDAPDAASNVCSTAGLTCGATASLIACSGACWVGCIESTVFATAKQRCIDWGGELMRNDTVDIQTCMNTTFLTGTARGLGLEQASTATMVAMGWAWTNGAPLAYENWSGGQPSDNGGGEDGEEQCAYMSNPGGAWQDVSCIAQIGAFACRR